MLRIKHIKITNLEKELLKEKIFNLRRTFCTKLFIKLTSKIIFPDLYLYILKFEYNNRTDEDIEKVIPKILNLKALNEYIIYRENKMSNDYYLMIKELAKISFYQRKPKNSIINKSNEDCNKFFYILNGSLYKFNLIFKKEKISIEEYLVYILKMKFIQEKQILDKCNVLNKTYINIDIDNIKLFFEQNKEYNYKQLKLKAKKELISEGFLINNNNKIKICTFESYINIGKFQIKERNDDKAITKYYIYIGQYEKIKTLEKGDIINDLSLNENNEENIYISKEDTDIAFINKSDIEKSLLNKFIQQKYRKIFLESGKNYYIFKDILNKSDTFFENNIFPFLIYQKYKKGENIIIQNSQYEGIYFILEGEVNINIYQNLNELSNTLISLQYSIFNFKDYVSKIIKTVDILNEFHMKYMINKQKNKMIYLDKDNKINIDVLSSNEYFDYLKGKKYISFYNLGPGEILGLNELFDYKTELYNFNATCISEEVHLFFFPKKYFNNIVQKETNIMNNLIQIIDFKAKALIGKINNFRIWYSKNVLNSIKNKKKLIPDNLNENNKEIKVNDNKCFNTFQKVDINKLKNKKNKIRNQNNFKLFKNNNLLKYLKDEQSVRNSSLSDIYNINIHEVLSKKKYFSPQFSSNKSFINNLVRNPINKDKRLIKDYSQNTTISSRLYTKNSNSIIFNKNINQLGDSDSLLFGVYKNQKKFEEFQKENFLNDSNNNKDNKDILPELNYFKNRKRNFKTNNVSNKKYGKTLSFIKINSDKFKI